MHVFYHEDNYYTNKNFYPLTYGIMKIKDKVVIVTGASSGIGLATAKLLSQYWANVVLAARSQDKLEHIAKEMKDVFVVLTDLTKLDDIRHLIHKTIEKYGRIDILFNNAGQWLHSSVEHTKISEYRQIMELNVFAVIQTMQEVIPLMRKQWGWMIINTSSLVSKNYFPMISAYASTKYALNAISLTARIELAKDNIIVSVIHPKITTTNFFASGLGEKSTWTGISNNNPDIKIDTPELVAQKILELIESEEAEASM